MEGPSKTFAIHAPDVDSSVNIIDNRQNHGGSSNLTLDNSLHQRISADPLVHAQGTA